MGMMFGEYAKIRAIARNLRDSRNVNASRVYLCGPIAGCTDDQAINWREIAKRVLGEHNCLDPMRRDYRGREDGSVAEIVELDKLDIWSCQVMLVNAWQPSWGTAMEVMYAFERRVPVMAVVPEGNVSPWIRYHATLFRDLSGALNHVKGYIA
jgi:hypothetical protein